MRVRRIIGSLVTAAMVATPLSLVATSAPASAAIGTKIVGGSKGWIYSTYRTQPGAPATGDTLYLDIDVKATDGSTDPYQGTVTVQRQLAGTSTWTTIATSDYAGYYGSTKAVRNATYRVLYSGSSTWAPSSAGGTVKVQHKVRVANHGNRRVKLVGKVGPKYRGKVYIQKRHGKRFKNWKVVRTNRRSTFTSYLPAPRKGRYYWRIIIPGNRNFAKTNSGSFYTYKL